ncbi:NAD(P)-binding domain-containing protein [Variovorax sp. LT1P1]|uniref:NAD(P)-binding domain-containing protein n=1 Tax=Variovorax sp. LT1P1 TaxID=3443730 RepID=UPI003F46868A
MTTTPSSTAPGLAALEQRLAKDLECLGWPARDWMPLQAAEDGVPVLDVAIIGAGQAGLAAAAALAQQGIHAVVFDRAPRDFEGPWATTARMETLRSPKELTGPALGLAALTFRAWFEAQFGADAWTQLDKIPRLQWMDYLRWYRRVMAVDVRNDTTITAVVPRADGKVLLALQTPAGDSRVLARRVVLATGRDGLGGPAVPAFVQALDRTQWAHSSDVMDYAQLEGLRVGVIGAGSSAMDSAATALEVGAKSVDLLIRRDDLPRINKSKGAGVPGLTQGHFDLPDDLKWRLRHYINVANVPPPHGSTLRVSRHPNARFNFGCPVLSVDRDGKAMRVRTPKGEFAFDFLIVSTGFKIDWSLRSEYTAIAPHVRAWKDRFTPLPGADDTELADSPDLGPVFELQEKTAGACPGLDRIHCFCYPATLSHGAVSGDIPAISDGARRLANGIASLFYREDFEHHFARLEAYDDPELLGNEWTPA